MKTFIRQVINKVVLSPIWSTAFILTIITLLAIYLSYEFYNVDFYENVLVEFHGVIFDLLIIGLLLFWLNEKARISNEISRYTNEIDDFRGWESEEASRKILGNIRRLNKNGITNIDLHKCYLRNIKLGDSKNSINLAGSNLYKTDFQGSTLKNVDFKNARLQNVNFKGVHFEKVNFLNSNLQGANFLDAKDLTAEKLKTADDLHGSQLATALEEELRVINPRLFQPKL